MFNGIIYNQGIISKLSAFKSSLKIDIKDIQDEIKLDSANHNAHFENAQGVH